MDILRGVTREKVLQIVIYSAEQFDLIDQLLKCKASLKKFNFDFIFEQMHLTKDLKLRVLSSNGGLFYLMLVVLVLFSSTWRSCIDLPRGIASKIFLLI